MKISFVIVLSTTQPEQLYSVVSVLPGVEALMKSFCQLYTVIVNAIINICSTCCVFVLLCRLAVLTPTVTTPDSAFRRSICVNTAVI